LINIDLSSKNMETKIATTRSVFVHQTISRLMWCFGSTTITTTSSKAAVAVETIGKDPNCNTANCLGIWDGLLANCDHSSNSRRTTMLMIGGSAGCVSSQDDTPGTFAEPWDYSEDTSIRSVMSTTTGSSTENNDPYDSTIVQSIMERIVQAIQKVSNRRGDTVEIIFQQQRYLHVLWTDHNSHEISDGEFYITPHDTTIQFRISTTQNTTSPRRSSLIQPSLRNIDRAELIRKELQWLKLPILRNRQRAFFFIESDQFDTFGPQSAALGPPEEMSINTINGL
jgi:uncharacterized protein (DUF1499 family)